MASNYERDKKSIMNYQKNNTARIVVNLKKEEKQEWQEYAKSEGIPLATLIRLLMNERIAKKEIN